MSKEIKDKNIKLLKSIGEKLRSKRKELKISQGKIADLLDISDTQIYRYELGYSLIPLDNLLKLCELFNVDIYYFLGDIKKEKQENISIINYPANSELEKIIITVKEVYEFGDDDLILGVNNCVNSMQVILKKRQKQGRYRETPKKKKNANS
jgi:transcriptional regulator with XRE-family HTH domain